MAKLVSDDVVDLGSTRLHEPYVQYELAPVSGHASPTTRQAANGQLWGLNTLGCEVRETGLEPFCKYPTSMSTVP